MENEKTAGNGSSHHRRRPCPVCNGALLRRIKRQGWMAWVPYSKYYSCPKCRTGFLRIFSYFQFKVNSKAGRYRETKTS